MNNDLFTGMLPPLPDAEVKADPKPKTTKKIAAPSEGGNLVQITCKVSKREARLFEQWCAAKDMTPYEVCQYFIYMAITNFAAQRGATFDDEDQVNAFLQTFGMFAPNEDLRERLSSLRAAFGHGQVAKADNDLTAVILCHKGGIVETLDPHLQEDGCCAITAGQDTALKTILSIGQRLPALYTQVMRHRGTSLQHTIDTLFREEADYIGYEESKAAQGYSSNDYGKVPVAHRNKTIV